MNINNPYHRGARLYETNLRLPLIASIRRHEARAVGDLIARYARPSGNAIEIGPGTGFYTLALARAFRDVVAVEDSAQMVEILQEKLQSAGVTNVRVIHGDFRNSTTAADLGSRISNPDLAVAIGVLDYIADPQDFVARMCALAQRAVIVSAPQRGLLGRLFAAGGAMRNTQVYCYDRATIASWAPFDLARGRPAWHCTIAEAGRTPLFKGLTLVAAFERA